MATPETTALKTDPAGIPIPQHWDETLDAGAGDWAADTGESGARNVRLPDGFDVTLGTKADAVAGSDLSEAWSLVSLWKAAVEAFRNFAALFDGLTNEEIQSLATLETPPNRYLVSSAFDGAQPPYYDDLDTAVTDALAAIAGGATAIDVHVLDRGVALPDGETWDSLYDQNVILHRPEDVDVLRATPVAPYTPCLINVILDRIDALTVDVSQSEVEKAHPDLTVSGFSALADPLSVTVTFGSNIPPGAYASFYFPLSNDVPPIFPPSYTVSISESSLQVAIDPSAIPVGEIAAIPVQLLIPSS